MYEQSLVIGKHKTGVQNSLFQESRKHVVHFRNVLLDRIVERQLLGV